LPSGDSRRHRIAQVLRVCCDNALRCARSRTDRAFPLHARDDRIIDARPNAAQTYPSCAVYGGKSGTRNCGFTPFLQCQEAL